MASLIASTVIPPPYSERGHGANAIAPNAGHVAEGVDRLLEAVVGFVEQAADAKCVGGEPRSAVLFKDFETGVKAPISRACVPSQSRWLAMRFAVAWSGSVRTRKRCPSADQNGWAAPSVPPSGCAASGSSVRIQNWLLPSAGGARGLR